MRSRSSAIRRSAVSSPTGTATEIAMQRSPAEPKAAPTRASAAISRSASGMTTAWFLAPPKHCARLPMRPACA